MDWDNLRFFLVAYRRGSLSAASTRLDVAVATVGRRIDQLEASLGLTLFERTPAGLVATPAGTRFAQYAEDIEARVAAVEREAQGEQTELAGTVRISSVESVASEIIANRLAAFTESHPNIHLVIVSERHNVDLAKREADVAIRLVRPRGSNLRSRRVVTLEYGLFASTDYLQRRSAPKDPLKSLAGHDLVALDARFDRVPEVAWLHLRADGARFALRANSITTLAAAVRGGVGIGMLPEALADDDLVRLVEPTDLPRRDLWIAYHQDLRKTAPVRAVVDYLAELLAAADPRLY